MKAIYTLLIILIPFVGLGQGWEQSYILNSPLSTSTSIQQTNDGGYIVTGYTESFDNEIEVFLFKTNESGTEQWLTTFDFDDSIESSYGLSVQQTSDEGFIITGFCDKASVDKANEILLIKTDENGIEQWSQTFGYNKYSDDRGYSVQQTTDGGYIVTGSKDFDVYLHKTDENGNEIWSNSYNEYGQWGFSVQQTTDGGYIITGGYNETTSSSEFIYGVSLIKTDGNGTKEWSKLFDGIRGRSVKQTSDGGYIITGIRYNVDFELCLIKTDENGNEQWYKIFESSYGNSVQQTTDGGYIITGKININEDDDNESDIGLIKTDENGIEQWSQTFGGGYEDSGNSVQQTIDGGFIICGFKSIDGKRVYLIKTNSFGNITSTIEIPLSNTNRKLEKTVNIKGQEINSKTNQPIVEIYNDGSIEKKVIIE